MKQLMFAALASAFMAITPTAAPAATVHYELTGAATASWDLDRKPTPNSSTGTSFVINNLSGTFPMASPVNIEYYTSAASPISGGFALFNNNPANTLFATGDQLFTGPTSKPFMKLGTFILDQAYFFEGNLIIVPRAFTLVATTTAIPEPEVWALLVVGFAAAGGILRARHRHIDDAAR